MIVMAVLAVVIPGVSTACEREMETDTHAHAPTSVAAALAAFATAGSPSPSTATASPTGAAAPPTVPVTTAPALPAAESVDAAAAGAHIPPTTSGIDVSMWQPDVDWHRTNAAGFRFAYVSVVGSAGDNPHFGRQWSDAKNAGIYRGAYYFGDPTTGTGKTHATRFLDMVGDMRDGRTLPPVLDVERHPHQAPCNGVHPAVWVEYVRSFVAEVQARTRTIPVIYTNRDFWQDCVGDTTAFARSTLLFAAQWNVAAPDVFGGWPRATFWQHSNTGRVPGIDANTDLDIFFGTPADLQTLTVPKI